MLFLKKRERGSLKEKDTLWSVWDSWKGLGSPGPATSHFSATGWKQTEPPWNGYLKEAVGEVTSLGHNCKSEVGVKARLLLKTRETPGALSKDCDPPGHGALEGRGAGPPGSPTVCLIEHLCPSLDITGWCARLCTWTGPSSPGLGRFWRQMPYRNNATKNAKPTLSIYFIKKFLCINFLKILKLKLNPPAQKKKFFFNTHTTLEECQQIFSIVTFFSFFN